MYSVPPISSPSSTPSINSALQRLPLRHTCRLAGVAVLTLLAACSHTLQSVRLQQAPPAELPVRHELVNTPFFAQSRYQCGPAALATVLADRGIIVVPENLTEKVYLPGRKGSLPLEMEAAARDYGMLVYPLAEGVDVLLGEIAAGNPVLVLQNLGFDWWPRWHYAVAVGYDLNKGEITLRSGVTRRYRVSMAVFETTWRRAEYWARVILPPETLPASAQPLAYIRAAVDLEQSGQSGAAMAGYRAASQRWPDAAIFP